MIISARFGEDGLASKPPPEKKQKTNKGRLHNFEVWKQAVHNVLAAAEKLVDAVYKTGIPTIIVCAGRGRHWDPHKAQGFREIYDQVAMWARQVINDRIMRLYANPAKAKPRIAVTSGAGILDTLRNGDDDYHLHPGPDHQDMYRFAENILDQCELKVLFRRLRCKWLCVVPRLGLRVRGADQPVSGLLRSSVSLSLLCPSGALLPMRLLS